MSRLCRLLATMALAAGVFAAIAGTPQPPLRDDEVSAVDLAVWIRERRDGLLVLDAREAGENADPGVPGARRMAQIAGEGAQTGLIVVYAESQLDDAVFDPLRRRFPDATLRRLRGGLQAWTGDVLYPSIRADAPARIRDAFAERAALGRYFGGTPRRIAPDESPTQPRSRRGC